MWSLSKEFAFMFVFAVYMFVIMGVVLCIVYVLKGDYGSAIVALGFCLILPMVKFMLYWWRKKGVIK